MECASCHNPLGHEAVYCPACGALQPGKTEPEDYEYAAFISYRHLPLDTKAATRVQKAIETYRLPRGVDAETGTGRSLGKCFRDEDELSAAHSLPDRIRDALAKSRALVVVCSPDTQQSAWVTREIETFAELHGRKRIFAVLADGSSQESIPNALKTITVIDVEGKPCVVPAQPLAADFRSQSAERMRNESLRVIAAIAGCGFDDLRRRERSRRTRRLIVRSTAAVVILALVGGIALFGKEAHRNAQIEESQRLATKSMMLLQQGDRYGAVQAALDALPSSATSGDRPFVKAAEDALEAACEVYPDETSLWRSCYAINTDDDIAAFARSKTQNWFATLSTDLQLTIHDQLTGKTKASCELPVGDDETDKDPAAWTLLCCGDYLLAHNFYGSGILACFDAQTGATLWTQTGLYADAIDFTPDETATAFCSIIDNGDGTTRFGAARIELATGEVTSVQIAESTAFPTSDVLLPCAVSEDNATFFCIADDTIAAMSLDDGELTLAHTELPNAYSLKRTQGQTIVSSYEHVERDSGYDTPYAVQAFDDALNPQWAYHGQNIVQVARTGMRTGEDRSESVDEGLPSLTATKQGTPAVLVYGGNDVIALDPADGTVLYDERFSDVVLSAFPLSVGSDAHELVVTTNNGSVLLRNPLNANDLRLYRTADLQLGQPLEWATTCTLDVDGRFYLLATVHNEDTDLVSTWRTTFADEVPDEDKDDYSLDELIAYGHELLDP